MNLGLDKQTKISIFAALLMILVWVFLGLTFAAGLAVIFLVVFAIMRLRRRIGG